jgi:hypothetical protein
MLDIIDATDATD